MGNFNKKIRRQIKIGLIARDNNRGLGVQSWEFYKHIKPEKTLVLEIDGEQNYPQRYPDARFCESRISQEDIDWLLDGIDLVLTFEDMYNWDIIPQARKKGVKTVIQLNYEWLRPSSGIPDLYLAPSIWNYEKIPEPKKYLPCPVNRELLPFQLRKRAKVFFHNAGDGRAAYGRDGTDIVLKAIPLVKSNVKFIINAQYGLERIRDNRVEWRIKDYENYWEGIEGDVYLYPRRYGGLSLKLNEAMSKGLVPIMIDCPPVNTFLPKELLIKPRKLLEIFIQQWVKWYDISPQDLAQRIDKIANKDITEYSQLSNHIAENWSWEKLLPKYLKTFQYVR